MRSSTSAGRRYVTPIWALNSAAAGWLLLLIGLLVVPGCAEKHADVVDSRNYLVEAREAILAGDSAKAMESLQASIKAKPNTWAYLELAKLQLAAGDDKAAIENCELGLKLDSSNADLRWLQGEANKPEGKRFKGRFKNPPSSGK